MQVKGIVKSIIVGVKQSAPDAEKKWRMDTIVLEHESGQYPKCMALEVFNNAENPRMRNWNLNVGDTVHLSFDIDAREYQGKWYNSIRAFKAEVVGGNTCDMSQGTVGVIPANQQAAGVAAQQVQMADPMAAQQVMQNPAVQQLQQAYDAVPVQPQAVQDELPF